MSTTVKQRLSHLAHFETPSRAVAGTAETTETAATPRPAGLTAALGALRIATGFIFLWAFLDKTFGLGYSTPSARSWVNGGSPTDGFLSHVEVGPFAGFFHDIAGTWWADWGFMLGLLGLGIALIAGIGLRIAAVGGTVLMLMMWAAEWPLDKLTSAGDPSGSVNPIVDYHIIYALAMITFALLDAGRYFGVGAAWQRITKNHSLLK